MFTFPNLISFFRIPLAFLFLFEDLTIRIVALFLAMITDAIDGFIARRYAQTSRLGTIIDPIADKFFVLFVLLILIGENQLTIVQTTLMFCRDLALALFGGYLLLSNNWSKYQFRSIFCGKATTFLQFIVILALIFHIPIDPQYYYCFPILGIGAFAELYLRDRSPAC